MSYDNTNKGAIWGNKDKKSDTHPDFKGSINIEGVEYWLSGWKRDPNGNPNAPSVKFSVQRKEDAGYQQPPQQSQPAPQQAPQQSYQNQQAPQQQTQQHQQHGGPVAQQQPQQAPTSGFDDFDDDIPF